MCTSLMAAARRIATGCRDELEDGSGKNDSLFALRLIASARQAVSGIWLVFSLARSQRHYSLTYSHNYYLTDLLHYTPLHSAQPPLRPLHSLSIISLRSTPLKPHSLLVVSAFETSGLGMAESEDDHAHLQPTSPKRLQIGQDTG